MNTQIKEALESLRDPLIHNVALADCLNLINLGRAELESHFQVWLWLPTDETYKLDAADEGYAKQLSQIEEHLVLKGLIYNE